MWERLRKFKYQAQYKSKWILSYDWLDSIVVSLAIYPFILNPIYKKKKEWTNLIFAITRLHNSNKAYFAFFRAIFQKATILLYL